jgi:hypothetical protein
MRMSIEGYKAIQKFSKDLEGVFTLPDLKVILDEQTEVTFFRAVRKLLESGDLIKIKRGFYATPDASLAAISCRLEPDAYISTGTVLAQHAIIGSIPAHRIQAVKVGRPRIYKCPLGTIEHLSIAPHLYFGFNTINGRKIATKEKAFLDVWYYYYKGKTFSFDPATDIHPGAMDMRVVNAYLKKYDKQFVSFFKKFTGEPR